MQYTLQLEEIGTMHRLLNKFIQSLNKANKDFETANSDIAANIKMVEFNQLMESYFNNFEDVSKKYYVNLVDELVKDSELNLIAIASDFQQIDEKDSSAELMKEYIVNKVYNDWLRALDEIKEMKINYPQVTEINFKADYIEVINVQYQNYFSSLTSINEEYTSYSILVGKPLNTYIGALIQGISTYTIQYFTEMQKKINYWFEYKISQQGNEDIYVTSTSASNSNSNSNSNSIDQATKSKSSNEQIDEDKKEENSLYLSYEDAIEDIEKGRFKSPHLHDIIRYLGQYGMENKEKFKKELFPEESSLEELYSDGPELAAELTNVFHISPIEFIRENEREEAIISGAYFIAKYLNDHSKKHSEYVAISGYGSDTALHGTFMFALEQFTKVQKVDTERRSEIMGYFYNNLNKFWAEDIPGFGIEFHKMTILNWNDIGIELCRYADGQELLNDPTKHYKFDL